MRWLSDYLEAVRAIYAIRVYPEPASANPDALDAIIAIRTALADRRGRSGGNGTAKGSPTRTIA